MRVAAMKQPGLVLQVLALITVVSTAGGPAVPIRAEGAPVKALEAAPTSAASPEASGLSDKEKALLQKINALKAPRWRSFGACRYDWAGWKLMGDGVRTTGVECGPETSQPAAKELVAVHCDSLKLSIRSGDQPWSGWRLPYAAAESTERGGEDRMVASLCANAKPIPKPQPAAPPAVNPTAKPVATKPAATPSTKMPGGSPAQKPPAAKP